VVARELLVLAARDHEREVANVVAREVLVLAARELIVLILVVAFLIWIAYRLVRESRR
jgi:flagellar biogenesis protein FliO